jgi:hypothetical protein
MYIEYKVLKAVIMKIFVVLDISLCIPLKDNRRSGETFLHLQDQRISQARNKREAGSKKIPVCYFLRGGFFVWLIFRL